MYKELRKTATGEAEGDSDDEDEEPEESKGCTIEEIKDEPAAAESKPEERVSMAEMVNDIDVGQEFVSNLEELD